MKAVTKLNLLIGAAVAALGTPMASYAAEKAAAMNLWADRLTAIAEGGVAKVLPLERERKRQG